LINTLFISNISTSVQVESWCRKMLIIFYHICITKKRKKKKKTFLKILIDSEDVDGGNRLSYLFFYYYLSYYIGQFNFYTKFRVHICKNFLFGFVWISKTKTTVSKGYIKIWKWTETTLYTLLFSHVHPSLSKNFLRIK